MRLYCDPISSVTRRACLTVLDEVFNRLITWLAPILAFTCEEAYIARTGDEEGSVHLLAFLETPAAWRDEGAGGAVAQGAPHPPRGAGRAGGGARRQAHGLLAGGCARRVYVTDDALAEALSGLDLAEIAITSDAKLIRGEGPADTFRLADVPGVAVVPADAEGTKCARSWKVSPAVGTDPEFPDVTPRDAAALPGVLRRPRCGGVNRTPPALALPGRAASSMNGGSRPAIGQSGRS